MDWPDCTKVGRRLIIQSCSVDVPQSYRVEADYVQTRSGTAHKTLSAAETMARSVELYKGRIKRTIQSGVVWLNMCFLHGAVLDNKGVTLGTVAAEDGRAVKGEIKTLGEGQAGICQEANLERSVDYNNMK